MKACTRLWMALFFTIVFHVPVINASDFKIVSTTVKASIVYDPDGSPTDSITAYLLAKDIQQVTGYLPVIFIDIAKASGNVIIIGNYKSALIASICATNFPGYRSLEGQWETYALKIIANPAKNIKQALLIIGSDARGTAYGVFSISEKIGISPWYWWADMPVTKKKELTISQDDFFSLPPSVKYRGIFLNDEDWGLQPWAAKTFEPETGDIGPATYARIFELLLRLKANLIWPAMHPSTKPFFFYQKNKQIALDYSIIIGSSHAEPMLRNNVGEWDSKTMGPFNYITNRDSVYAYWDSRVKESGSNEVIYTLGMRGIHDSGMEGVKSPKEAVSLLTGIIEDQRNMLTKHFHTGITTMPQVFTAYKEVLDIYDIGLKIPDDVTLVWPDDNYGYIQRLNDSMEQQRSGGSGIYYHASYWGRPHDYLWLSTTHPALIREEMMKAYENKSNQLWVLNVGDIKPLEYNISLFMDMAYRVDSFKDSRYVKQHIKKWYSKVFGKLHGETISRLMWDYYQLAFERRPEFMGWSQTEPTTQTRYTDYNHFYYGDEAQRRIDKYAFLEKQVRKLQSQLQLNLKDAFYELVYYPAVCASLMNKKFLYRDKAYLYSRQGRISAKDHAVLSVKAYDSIVAETEFYNNKLAGSKWKYMMSMKPRNLPVFNPPAPLVSLADRPAKWNITPEGTIDSAHTGKEEKLYLPEFNYWTSEKYFIDIYLCDSVPINWTASVSGKWIRLSQQKGNLLPAAGRNEIRIWVSIDWSKASASDKLNGSITFNGGNKKITIEVKGSRPENRFLQSYKGAIETNKLVSFNATSFTEKKDSKGAQWSVYKDLGHTGNSLLAGSAMIVSSSDTTMIKQNAAYAEYSIYTFTASDPIAYIYSLPTHPVNKTHSMRYAVSFDNGPIQVIDFRTIGRSEEWKQNVLRNSAVKKIQLPFTGPGMHTLRIYTVDPGVLLDRIVIDMGGMKPGYGVIPETISQF